MAPLLAFMVFLLMAASNVHAVTGVPSKDVQTQLLGPGDADMVTSISVYDAGSVVYVGTDVGGIYKSADHGRTWNHRNHGLLNYDISTPVLRDPFSKDLYYVGTRGGFYKTSDGAETWKARWNGLSGPRKFALGSPIGAITVDSMQAGVLYLGFGCRPDNHRIIQQARDSFDGVIYRSGDYGENWEQLSGIGKGACIRYILQHPREPDTLYICSDRGIFRSLDAGHHWLQVHKSDSRYIYYRESDGTLFSTSATEGVSRSLNDGDSWVWCNEGLPLGETNNYSMIVGSPDHGDVLYLLNSTWGPGGGMYRYSPNRNIWGRIVPYEGGSNLPETWLRPSKRINAIALQRSEIFIGTSRSLYLSVDKGMTWAQLVSQQRPDGGWSHRGLNVFGQTRSVACDPRNPLVMFLGTTDHGLLKTTNGGASWHAVETGLPDYNDFWDVVFPDQAPQVVYAIALKLQSSTVVLRGENSGSRWKRVDSGDFQGKRLYTLLCSRKDSNRLLVAGDTGVYETCDAGNTWQHVNQGLPQCSVRCLSFSGDDEDVVLAGSDKGLFRKEKGLPWQLMKTPDDVYVATILIDSKNPDRIYMGTRMTQSSDGGIYMSDDRGDTWKKVLSQVRWVSSIVRLSQTLYASTNDDNYHDESSGDGIFRSHDSGRTWERVSWDLPVMRFYKMVAREGSDPALFFCANGSGLIKATGLIDLPREKADVVDGVSP